MNIVIVDDDNLVRISLKTILESSGEIFVSGMGKNGKEGIELFNNNKPDVLLMDIRMEEMSGIECARAILKNNPNAKILFLTTFLDDEYIIEALHIGAKGYLLKQNFESILPSLKAVYSGQTVFGTDIISKIPSLLNQKVTLESLSLPITEKDLELITLIAQGLSNKEIAVSLFLSEGTIRNYLSVILDKLELRDRTQLAIYYYKNHLDLVDHSN